MRKLSKSFVILTLLFATAITTPALAYHYNGQPPIQVCASFGGCQRTIVNVFIQRPFRPCYWGRCFWRRPIPCLLRGGFRLGLMGFGGGAGFLPGRGLFGGGSVNVGWPGGFVSVGW